MNKLIENYINNLTINDINKFAIKNNINLSIKELDFTYKFLKSNYKELLNNHGVIDIDQYKDKYTEENFIKIKQTYKKYYIKYNKYI